MMLNLPLTTMGSGVYAERQVLNTPHLAACTAPVRRGFFASIAFCLWPGSTQEYKTRKGNTVGRLDAVFNYLAAPLNKGRSLNNHLEYPCHV